MVSLAPGPLTRIGFRRDVRVFLTALVGFLALLIFLLLFELQAFSQDAQASVLRRWNAVADAATLEIRSATGDSGRRLQAMYLLQRYGILAIEFRGTDVERFGTPAAPDEEPIVRSIENVEIRYVFDDGELRSIERSFTVTASFCVAAAVTGMVLLFFYLPRITRPIEAMLGEATQLGPRQEGQEETAFLLQTFRDSIARLKSQESELKRLHESEKMRADELALVSATLTRSLTSGFVSFDADGRVIELNAAARETLGIPSDATAQQPLATLIGTSPLSRAIEEALNHRETLTRIEVEHAGMTIGLTAVPLFGDGDRFLGMIALFTDLTPIKRLEARVRAMQTLADLGEMAAGIVHELRNSMSTIAGYIRLVQRSELPAEAATRLRAAEEEAALLHSAIDRLLAFARPMKLQFETVDLRQLTDGVVSRLRESAPQIAFETHGDAVLEGDATLLSRAVENIVRNALDAVAARPGAGHVSITISAEPPAIVIADDGIGLDPAQAERLLLPFVSEKPGGFGLGLSLARKIAILHGGDIELHGVPGEGTTVTLRLHAHAAA
jgi:signal transduction histidine kinase